MEIIIIGLLPLLFLLLAASMLVVSQITGFFQFSHYSARERGNSRIISQFIDQMAMAQVQLASRSKELEDLSRKLRFNNEELARLNTLKTKFLSMVVHDVRTPLSSIKGYSEILDTRGKLGPNEKKYVSYVLKASEQINHLLGDLTDLAVIEAGKMRMEKATFDLASFVGEITPPFGLLASKKGVTFTVSDVPEGVALTADRFRVGRVLTNLMGNALKFTPAGGKIELRVRLMGREAHFLIKDTGPGIHPSERKRIFEKFYQSQFMKDPKARAAGWGLGLAISEEIVRSHSGAIGVDSAGLGKGSTFWVRVPLVPPRLAIPARRVVAALAAGFLALGAGRASAQIIPLEEKAKYEKALESKVDGVLLRILGPNRSKCVVEATVDFTRIERFEAKGGTMTVRSVKNLTYLWSNQQSPSQAGVELLPGVPLPQSPQLSGQDSLPALQSYERQNTYPTEFLKRLGVTVILDRSVTNAQSDELRKIVGDLLEVAPARGDTLNIVHTAFTPIWKTVWYEPETASLLFRYVAISLLGMVALIIVAVSFMKLAGAMSAMARSQSQQITMEMRGGPASGGGGAAGGLLGAEGLDIQGARPRQGEDAAPAPGSAEEIVFSVRPEQVETLADMLKKEDPANIALVAAHLKADMRQGLLKALPPALSEQVFASLGRVRFVEPEVILNLKEELERRLSGAVGGLGRLVEMVAAAEMSERRRLIEGLRARDAELAAQVRRRVFLIEDLASLSREEWSHLNSRIGYDDWAAALGEGPEIVVKTLQANLPEGAWKILEQMIHARTSDAKARAAAQEKVAKAVSDLVEDGRLLNPAEREPRRLETVEAGAPARAEK